ncbi:ovarian-specific serine/threonine-protein kinase Lok isoform X2 [Anopheles bellator]|uniref:ovarian-specific serine/threonine-protein kinase Lok isoform X2 n=1 Tax=Anopheles bellator TaxID=139047 RepID=UPI002647196A|nr:ovarian-specific serine/threonine-protein kinase Lok isoform X2 [Anopheles bellator]
MANDIADTQPATQSQMQSQCTLLESQPPELPVYGRLCAKNVQIESQDLHDGEFKVGRDAERCHLILKEEHMPASKLSRVSNVHFIITKGPDISSPVYITDNSRNGTFINNARIGKHRQQILKHDDVISICFSNLRAFVYHDLRHNDAESKMANEVQERYYIERQLGSGACGTVYLLHHIRSCQQFAMKHVVKNRISQQTRTRPGILNDPQRVMNEVNIMKKLDHPCVIKMHDIFDKPDSVYMVLEYMKGGDLLSRIVKNQKLSEKTSKLFFLQMCHAVGYLHKQGITHRDLKPDNILLQDDRECTLLKVSDFGLSKFVDKNSIMRTLCGTPLYVAPEILQTNGNGSYTRKIDIWSMGVVLFTMLSGNLPFSDAFGSRAVDQIKSSKFSVRSPAWQGVSSKAKKLIYEILNVNAKKRPSIEDLIKSIWLRDPVAIADAKQLMGDSLALEEQPRTTSDVENNSAGPSRSLQQPPSKRQRVGQV